jgi:hypothetical protein
MHSRVWWVAALSCGAGFAALAANGAEEMPFQMALLSGYQHEPLQGIDSVVGKISKAGGLTIQYEIGRVVKPGQPRLGGDFTDYAERLPPEERQWLKTQQLPAGKVNLAYSKMDVLFASFPETGVNFNVTVKSAEELAEALLLILSYEPKGNAPADGLLRRRASLDFKRNSLEMALQDLMAQFKDAEPALEIKILGKDLQMEGITRNMSIRDFSMKDAPVADILTEIVVRANPVTGIKPNSPDQRLVWVVGPHPEDASRQAILVTTRAAAANNGYELPAQFVAQP